MHLIRPTVYIQTQLAVFVGERLVVERSCYTAGVWLSVQRVEDLGINSMHPPCHVNRSGWGRVGGGPHVSEDICGYLYPSQGSNWGRQSHAGIDSDVNSQHPLTHYIEDHVVTQSRRPLAGPDSNTVRTHYIEERIIYPLYLHNIHLKISVLMA